MRRRRCFLCAMTTAAIAVSIAAQAQQQDMAVVGFLTGASDTPEGISGLHRGFTEAGFIEGRNLTIETRNANGRYDQLPALAADLLNRKVALILTATPVAAQAAKAATATIPIVFMTGADPIKLGLVASLNRPGGNVTGVTFLLNQLGAKRLEMLHRIVPQATAIAVLVNPNNSAAAEELRATQDAAQSLGLEVVVLRARTEKEIDAALAEVESRKLKALQVFGDLFLDSAGQRITAFSTSRGIATSFDSRKPFDAGPLMSYGPDIPYAFQQGALYAARILRGEKPGEIPVLQASKFEFLINLRTAKALGLTVPPAVLAIADEVIE